MTIAIILFIIGLVALIKGGDWFVDGATGIAKRFHIPELLIGATIVSIGTTLPEVMVSATSAFSGHGEIAYGNAIGSIICNTSLIAAITIAIKPAKIDKATIIKPVCFFTVATILYSIASYKSGFFPRWFGFVLLAIFVIYMFALIKEAISPKSKSLQEDSDHESGEEKALWLEIVFLILGAALIAVGSKLLVDNGTIIAEKLGVPEAVIALTFVALGTSLPELVTAITSLAKGHGALSLGNIIGANLFNLVLVSGVSIAISPFSIPESKTVLGVNSSLIIDIPVMIAVMSLMIIPALIKGKLYRFQGVLLLCIYAAFCALQFLL